MIPKTVEIEVKRSTRGTWGAKLTSNKITFAVIFCKSPWEAVSAAVAEWGRFEQEMAKGEVKH